MALRACSLAAQGLWMRMLCVAAQHDPTGYVSVNRVGLDPDGIAKIAGAGVDEVRSLIGELSLNGVFSRDQHGAIYNRRMLRDERKASVARKNGKLGGNPTLCNNLHSSPSDKGPLKPRDKPGDNLKPIPISDLRKKEINKEKSPSEKDVKEILGTCLSPETAAEVVAHRKALKKPLTSGSAKGLAKAFSEFGDAEKAASTMMLNGWQGFNPEWMRNVKTNGHTASSVKLSESSPVIFIEEDTPQWNAWAEFWKKTKGVTPNKTFRRESMSAGWYFPTEWPPNES